MGLDNHFGTFLRGGEFLSKEFALSPGWGLFGFILLVDVLSISAWLPAIYQKNQLSIIGVVWSLASLMLTVGVGVLVFNEKLTPIRILGIFFGIIALILLSW